MITVDDRMLGYGMTVSIPSGELSDYTLKM